jgi:DNA-binding XRE family transcriptional regulator
MKGIIKRLQDQDLTVKWLANKLGVNRTTIWRWDKGDNCKHEERINELLDNEYYIVHSAYLKKGI